MGSRRIQDDKEDEIEDVGVQRLFKSAWKFGSRIGKFGLKAFQWSARKGGRVLWVSGTTAIMVILPLMMEIDREQGVIEMENLRVKDLQAQGVPPQQIVNMGLTLPQEPAVMT